MTAPSAAAASTAIPPPSREVESTLGFASRAVRVASGLVKVHLEFAKREADRDKQRVIGALATAAIGGVLLALGLVLLDVFAVVLVNAEARLPLHWSILAVCGGNVAIGGLLLWVASRRLRAPVMPETRDLVQKTLTAMTDG
ncbi:MAG: phage holin family protein [Polyangiaceae bacterium]